jgi:thiamine biosynthesis lipoprotein
VPPLLRAWGFGPGADPDAPAPTPDALAQLAERIGYQKLHLDLSAPSARKDHPSSASTSPRSPPATPPIGSRALSPSAGSPATTSTSAASYACAATAPAASPGGSGSSDPRPAKSAQSRPLQEIVHLSDHALATSGDYRNYRELDGRRISHTIDPRSRAPITHNLASVTVIHRDAARADALATALTVLGPDQGMALAERQGLAVLMIIRVGDTFELRSTPAFDALRRPASSATL